MKASELDGALLDLWVARAENTPIRPYVPGGLVIHVDGEVYAPGINWAWGGPIIEREMIELTNDRGWREDGQFGRIWEANHAGFGYMDGDSALVAAMRAYVGSKFGDELPDVCLVAVK